MTSSRTNSPAPAGPALLFAAVALLACSLTVAILSYRFVYGVGHAERPLLAVAAVLLAGGLAWALALRSLARGGTGQAAGFAVILVAAVLGGIQVRSQPIQEVEFYRYLLDGGVAACGESPYALTPAEQGRALETLIDLRSSLGAAALAEAGPCLTDDERWLRVISRVPFAENKSETPPAAVWLFAGVVELMGPDPVSLRIVFWAVVVLTTLILAALLGKLGFSPALAVAYG